VNLAVCVAQFPNQRVFKFVLALGAYRVDQTLIVAIRMIRTSCQTMRITGPLGAVAVTSNPANLGAGKVRLQPAEKIANNVSGFESQSDGVTWCSRV
jgi:hypothetical protein